jgi:hypothetical protein
MSDQNSDSPLVSEILGEVDEGMSLKLWLVKNPDASAVFWEVMEKGYAIPRRNGQQVNFTRLIEVWRSRYPHAPKPSSHTKRWVDARFRD